MLIYSGEQLELTRRIDGPEPGFGFGAALRVVADLDGDGVQELLVTCEAQSLIQVVDPRSGVALWSYRPATPFRNSPYLAFADVDGDGVADHLLASPSPRNTENTRSPYTILSGANGTPLAMEEATPGALEAFGRQGTGLEFTIQDLDGDELPESFRIAGPSKQLRGTSEGGWVVELAEIVGDWGDWAPRHVGDLTGDGIPDLVFGVTAISGANGRVVRTWSSDRYRSPDHRDVHDSFGDALLVADLTGDGRRDVVIGAPGLFQNGVYVFSGTAADPSRVLWLRPGRARDRLGVSLAAIPDRDGDGCQELIVGGTDLSNGSCVTSGTVRILSGRSGKTLWIQKAEDVGGL